jgi:hypothetical protein
MGAEATCRATINGRWARGKARLETDEIIFRGDGLRAVVKRSEIIEAAIREGVLELRTADDVLRLELGDEAAKWLKKIKNPPSRLDKLGLEAGMKVAVIGVSDPGLAAELADRGVVKARSFKGADVVLYGVETTAELGRLATLREAIKPDGAIWVVRRKGGAGVSEKDSMAAGKAAGLVDVKVCAFSATHTAEKYVIPRAAR